MKHFKTLILLICLLLGTLSSFSANKPNIINFNRDQYQAANKNWSISQDSLGIMYFGNDKGLLEFDGIRWKLYTVPKAEIVRAVAVSSDNILYTGGYEEFGKWERDITGTLNYTSLSQDLKNKKIIHNDDIWRIIVKDSIVYFQSFRNIYIYDQHSIQIVDVHNEGILFLIKVYDELWVQKMGKGLYRLSGKSLKEVGGSDFFKHTEVRIVLPYKDKQYLIGTSSGFYIYDGKTFKSWDSEISRAVKSNELNNGILRQNGNYFFGTIMNGVYEVSPSGNIVNHFSADNFLQNNTVLFLFEDNTNNIWAALDRGISYIQYLREMDCYIDPSGKTGAVYTASFFGENLYIGTNQGLFYMPKEKLKESASLSYLKLIDGTQGQTWDLEVFNDLLLCGHTKGLKYIDRNMKLGTYDQVNSGVFSIDKINYNKQDFIFLGTYTSPVVLFEKNHLNIITQINEPIVSITNDHLGNIWMGHINKGVYRFRFTDDMQNLKYIQEYGGDNKKYNLPFHLDAFQLGNRSIFSGNDSIFVYNDIDDKLVLHSGLTQYLSPIKSIKQIIPLSHDLFLVIGNDCIYKTFYDGNDIRILDSFDLGYNNLSLVNNYENAVLLDDSLCMICLDDGFLLHKIQSTSEDKNIELPSPHLRSIQLITSGGQEKYLSAKFNPAEISSEFNNISFDFFSEKTFTQNLLFQYKLEGIDIDWSTPTKMHMVTYERLPVGSYSFLLRTIDNLGNYSQPVTFTFKVLPPWYLSLGAYIGYIFLFVIILISIWFIILRRYRNIHLLKIRMREEKRLQRQNTLLKKEIENKNAELFSQTSFIIQKNELLIKVKTEIEDFYRGYSGNKTLKPLYEKVNSLLDKNINMEDDWKLFLIQFEQKHTGFFQKLKKEYPDLTPNDLKLCACLKLNMNTKDIAYLLNISPRGVENSRYRLRKKLNIPPSQNLNDYFLDR